MLGTVFPFIGRVIAPCDADGVPAISPDDIAAFRFETGAWVIAWLGRCLILPFGDVQARMIDPNDPRQYAPGDLF